MDSWYSSHARVTKVGTCAPQPERFLNPRSPTLLAPIPKPSNLNPKPSEFGTPRVKGLGFRVNLQLEAQISQASLAHAEVAAADSGSQSAAAAGLKADFGLNPKP